MTAPAISVIMGVYNCPSEQMLTECIESVVCQSFSDFEFLICDDGSENETYQWLVKASEKDSRIRLLRHLENQGLAQTLNDLICMARGELLFRQDVDDRSAPLRFERLLEAWKKYPECSLISSNILLFDEGGFWGKMEYPRWPERGDFLFCVPFMHGAVSMRKSAVLEAGGYSVERLTRRTEDIDLFMRMYCQGAIGYTVQEPLYYYLEDHTAHKRRKYRYKIDEARVKLRGYRRLGLMPKGLLYAAKPLLVGLLPYPVLKKLKDFYYNRKID